jgi:hypothetical protein
LYGAFVWARRALNGRKRRFPARAEAHPLLGPLVKLERCGECRRLRQAYTALSQALGRARKAEEAAGGSVGRCRAFQDGRCPRGDDCKFRHSPMGTPSDMIPNEVEGQDGGATEAGAETARVKAEMVAAEETLAVTFPV